MASTSDAPAAHLMLHDVLAVASPLVAGFEADDGDTKEIKIESSCHALNM